MTSSQTASLGNGPSTLQMPLDSLIPHFKMSHYQRGLLQETTMKRPHVEHVVLAAGTVIGTAGAIGMLTVTFLASLNGLSDRAHAWEAHAIPLLLMPLFSVIIEEVTWRTSAQPPHPSALTTSHAGWIALATLAPVGVFGCYVLAVGTLVALETNHNAWAALLGCGSGAAMAVATMALITTIRQAVRNG